MGARFLFSTGLWSGNLIGRAQFPPPSALDKKRSPKMGIPEKCWRGCWHRCWQKGGCWPECWHSYWQAGPCVNTETTSLPAAVPALQPAPPFLPAPVRAPPPALFWNSHFGVLYQVARVSKKSSSEQVFLNSFRWVPDSCHRETGKSSRELFEKVRVDAFFVGICGFWVGCWASIRGSWKPGNQQLPRARKPEQPAQAESGPISRDHRWAKSRDSYRRIASESYRSDSNH